MAQLTATYTSHGSELDALFPVPSLTPSVLCPQRYPVCSPAALAALTYVLKENHTKYHIFFNDKQFHNHIAHRALALYATGGSASLIKQFYEQDSTYQRPVIDPPEVVTEDNFIEHLGDENYYISYIAFFVKAIEEKGVATTLDRYIFSEGYNFVEGRDTPAQPVMLARFLGGLFHPFIHVGYGTEFGIPGMVAEGLAMASVHLSLGPMFLPPSLFERGGRTAVEDATTRFSSLLLNAKTPTPCQLEQPKGNHAFSILAKVMDDPEFTPKEMQKYLNDPIGPPHELLTDHGANIWRYAEQWTIDLSQPGEVERKMEECIWASTILYSIGGWRKEKGFRADFFSMHFVTASLFLPPLLPFLGTHKVTLLRAYFALILAWWIICGRPRLDNIQEFLDATASCSSDGEVPNPFLNVVQSGAAHSNEHMVKIQRALAHFSSLYGARPKGYFKDTGLEGAEALDGSLFFRAARLTEEYMGQGSKGWAFPTGANDESEA